MMDDFASETDSDYTSYWRDWVGRMMSLLIVYTQVPALRLVFVFYTPLVYLPHLNDLSTQERWIQSMP